MQGRANWQGVLVHLEVRVMYEVGRTDLLVSDAQAHKTARNPGLQIKGEVFPSHYRRNLMYPLDAKHLAANLLDKLPAAGVVDRSRIIRIVPNDLGRAAIGL